MSSIFVFDVGVALVKLIPLVDNEELIDLFERVNSGVDWYIIGESLEFELISSGVANIWLLITPFRRVNEGESFDWSPIISKWSIDSWDFLWRIIGLKGVNCFGGNIRDDGRVFVGLSRFGIFIKGLLRISKSGRRVNVSSFFWSTEFVFIDSFW